MIDNINPNSNFHPYQPIDAVPHSGLRTRYCGCVA
jgi:hypothetical protein